MEISVRRLIASFVILSVAFLNTAHAAQAGLISTEAVANAQAARNAAQDRVLILETLKRPELQAKMEEMGVSRADAEKRVAALSDREVSLLAEKIQSAPAGGSDALTVALIVFIVLLVTDILGFTNIFPFVKHGSGMRR